MKGGKHNGGTNTGHAKSLLLVETNPNNQRDAKTRKHKRKMLTLINKRKKKAKQTTNQDHDRERYQINQVLTKANYQHHSLK